MNNTNNNRINLIQTRRRHQRWVLAMVILSVLVSSATFMTLRYSAVAKTYQKRILDCREVSGTVAHIHNTEDCYRNGELVCPLEEIEPHEHTEACYTAVLSCGLMESEGHVHTEACFIPQMELACGLEETDGDETHPAHHHTVECYAPVRELICGLEETPGDETHPAHWHTDACYQDVLLQVCGMEEGFGAHRHTDECYEYVLTCEKPVLPVHVHGAECFRTEEMTEEEIAAMNLAESTEASESESTSEEGLTNPEGQTTPVDEVESESSENTETTGDEPAAGTQSAEEDANTEAGQEPESGKEPTDENADNAVNYPEQIFKGEAAGLLVTVNAPAGAFPQNTKMVVSPIEDEEVLNAATAEVQGEVVLVQGVDITFLDAEGNEIEPLVPIQVEMVPSQESAEIIPDITEVSNEQTLVHVDNELAATVMEQEDNTTPEVRFESDSFSAYIVVYTRIEKTVLASDGHNYRITVTCDPASEIPADATLEVEEIPLDSEIYDSCWSRTEAALAEDRSLAFARFFDISILAGGKEIQPSGPVQVKIELADLPEETLTADTQIVHFGESAEILTPLSGDGEISFQAESFSVYGVVYTVDFHYEVNGKTYDFSLPGGGFASFTDLVEVLGIARDTGSGESVDETAPENTEAAEGTPLTLGDVVVSDSTRKFVANVASIEFSTPSLVDVSRVESETTVGQIKQVRGLACEYSAELTEEQIAQINAQTVAAGDWALISMLPFESEESLTVTMKNGEAFTIRVTDAQIKTLFLSDSGELFEVTVTYDEAANIPEDAKLKVTEFDEYSKEFQDAWKVITGEDYFSDPDMEDSLEQSPDKDAEASEEKSPDDEVPVPSEIKTYPAGMAALDITIFNNEGQKVEPTAPVSVSIVMKSLPEDINKDELSETAVVYHLNDTLDGTVEEAVAACDGTAGEMLVREESLKAEFVVDSFSTYTITWGNATNTTTNLRFRENNTTRARVTVHYVDQDGNAISRPTGINTNTDQTVSWNYDRYTYNITTDNIARAISGYSYQGAYSGSYNGTEISSVTLQRTRGWLGYSYSTDVDSIYLVYSGETEGITVHYGYMNGGTFVEFGEEEDGDVPAGTTVPKPSQYGDQWDLEMAIPGYRYVTTRLNDPANGREISSLLNTDPPYKQNTNNTFENANQSAYPSYTSSTAPTSFVSEWRYRQLSKSDWNPTGGGWYYSDTEHVTANGVTKPVSFAESDKDIYVIYEMGSMSGGSGDGGTPDLGELNAPTTDKQVASNHDGTYDVTLSATSEKKNAESSTKANVVIVLDTSWSMYEKDAGNGQSRMSVAKSAIGSLADKLFALNAEESDTIELAFVNFAQRVRNEEEMRTIYSGTDATSFKNMINGLECAEGTNWDDALYAADHIYFNDNDPTYVVFITDGDPISCAHPYGTYSDWDGGTYYTGRSNYEYALAAKNQADLIIGHNKTLYTIGAFGEISNLQAIGGTYLGQANNTTAINGYFDDIISDIQSALGYQDVVINDGITALSSTGLARGDIASLRYYRSGGENANGSEKYNHEANDGHGEAWADAPAAYLLEVKSESGVVKYYKNGTEVSLSSLTDLSEQEYLVKYPVGTRTVIWDINAGSESLLEDGVTYTMIFTMWPSQEAYDLIADLNNKVVTYDSLTQAEKDQVFLGDDNVYYLKTNTKATVDYTSVKLVNGEVSGTPTSASAPIEDPRGKMNLDTSIMTVRKEFAHLINEADPYEEIVFYLLVDGKYYNKDGTLSDTLDESKVYAINLPKDGEWEDTIYIAPGLMRGGDILETGHNYSLVEKIVSGNPYEYEFAPQTVRPMVITAVPTFLVMKDSFNTNQENKKEYTFDDENSSYTEVDGKSDADGTYYVASENNGSLNGVNHKTSELDITKIIHDPQNLLTSAQEAAETFTYRVTLQIPDGCDPSGIVGYEYVPRTQSNAYTLFGYQTGQSAFSEDIERFNGKTFRAWNTLVYDALIEYERVTENGRTFIKAKRDADGNIIWKIPAVQGYHTITYDMTLKQDEVIRFTNLPTGTNYVIQEIYANKYPADNAGGKTDGRTPVTDASNLSAEGYEIEQVQHTGGTLSSDNATVRGTIEAPDTRYYNQFTNTKVHEDTNIRIELKVKKVVEDYTWGQEYYRFTLKAGTATYSDPQGGTGTSPMPDETQDSSVSIYNSTADHTLSFGTIRYTRPGTYTYTISEYDNSKNMPNVQFASPVTLTVTVTEENGKLKVSDIEDDKGTTVYSAGTDTALATGLTTQTNTSKKIHIQKVDKNHLNTVLADAQFEIWSDGLKLYLQNGKLLNAAAVEDIIGMSVSAQGAEAAMANKNIVSRFALGEIDISGFSYDVVYELKEISPPDGYIIVNGSTYFKAFHNNAQTYLRLTDQDGTVLVDGNNNPILDNDNAVVSENGMSISIKNEPGVELPQTGGEGTLLFSVIGTIFVLSAVMGLMARRKWEEAYMPRH